MYVYIGLAVGGGALCLFCTIIMMCMCCPFGGKSKGNRVKPKDDSFDEDADDEDF